MLRLFISLATAVVAAASIASGQCTLVVTQPTEETLTIPTVAMELANPAINALYTLTSNGGTITLSLLDDSPSPCTLNFMPVALNLTATDPMLGVVTTTLDYTQFFGVSRIVSISGPVSFPAAEDLFLPIEIRMSSQPGVVFRSVGEVHLRGTVFGWPPRGTRLDIIAPFTVENTRNPGVMVYDCRRFFIQF